MNLDTMGEFDLSLMNCLWPESKILLHVLFLPNGTGVLEDECLLS